MNKLKMYSMVFVSLLMSVPHTVYAHIVHDSFYISHDVTHFIYGFNHMPVDYAITLTGLLFVLGILFCYVSLRFARSAWLAAGGISLFAAGGLLVMHHSALL